MNQSHLFILLPLLAAFIAAHISEHYLSGFGVWQNFGTLTILGKIVALTLFFGPYIGSYFLLRNFAAGSLVSWDDYVVIVVIYLIFLIICLAPLFAMAVLLSGSKESISIKSIDVPTFVGKETNFRVERQPATEGIDTPFNKIICFNVMLAPVWFGLGCFIALPSMIYAMHFS